MTWSVQFYHERRGLLARYRVEAASASAAVLLGRRALLAEYPRAAAPARTRSLYERARAKEGDDGWALYRIGNIGARQATASVDGHRT